MTDKHYRGRFAPSPSGPLHFGSLVAATASYLQARRQRGEWRVRIDDIDPPREVAGASDAILQALAAFGFEWDGPVDYQHTRLDRYRDALAQLQAAGLAYPCGCSRKTITAHSPHGVYPGTCRPGLAAGLTVRTWRLRLQEQSIEFRDNIQGPQSVDLAREVGDFVLWRADGHVAYQLATGLDDAEQGMTEVVRGADLLNSTPRQLLVQAALGLPSPAYAHHPVVTGPNGHKLSKQNLAPPLDLRRPGPQLYAALRFLGQDVPAELAAADSASLWQWALAHWDLRQVPKTPTLQLDTRDTA
jgi:glutamyl-Q tRNA(Asp) synthetase